jgi:hypothetical protein
MKRNEIIRLVFTICLIILGNILEGYAQSPMDDYEKNMKTEYKQHDIGTLTNYILDHKEIGKSEFILDGKLYKMKVKESNLSGGYIQKPNSKNNEWVQAESLQFFIKNRHREYVYTLKGNKLELWSDNLSFLAIYDFEKKEVSIRKIRSMFNSTSPKLYGYEYSFANNTLEKVEDWIVRDADGRANSMGKHYGKNRTFTDN